MSETTHDTRYSGPEDASARGWVLYDGSCGICRRWAPFWENALRRRGYGIAPLQADWVRARMRMEEQELLKDLRLLLADGTHLSGAAVYRYAMKRIGWLWPVYGLSLVPGLRQIFDWSYRTFARNRHRVSDACGLR